MKEAVRDPILTINELVISFNGNRIVDGISLSLNPGENLVLLGKSGAGKSVIMKCIVRLIEPDSGRIRVFGQEVDNLPEREMNRLRTRIGYLFQDGALYDSMTIMENLLFPVRRNDRFRKVPEQELRKLALENLAHVGLAEAADKVPAELSGGMKKRAGLARTLMLSPELIIYDEPTTGLDPFTSESISRLIRNIQDQHHTASVIITHDIRCAEITGDRIMILHEGKILGEGTFEELKMHSNEEVRLFFK
jgi:phospholipid/cholesterol/gamma-HCH transport system ATP-binding protein